MAFMPTGFRALSALTRVQTRPWTPPHVLHLNARRLATVVDRSPAPNFHIPLIDFGKFLSATSIEEKQSTANEIAQGFKEVGFIYLSNHGIPESQVSSVHEKSAEFFRQPAQLKDSLAWEDPRSNRGYVKIGRERVTQSADADEIKALRAKAPDFKETMEIGRDWDATWRNRWPQETDVPGFKQTMLNFFYSCHKLHVHVLRAVALGLQLDERFFDEKIDEQYHNLRLLNYPAVKTSLLAGEDSARAGAHSDYGTLTLLFQDQVGGLQVRNPHTLEYQPAPPIPGTIVVNAGDLLARWSNDVLRSTLHRVVAPPTQRLSDTEGIVPARQSIAFFCNPNGGATIECLPNCGEKSKYEPVTTEDYIVGRLRATYT